MNIPLLQQQNNGSQNISLNVSPDKKLASLFGQAILQKYDIKNEIIEKVKLPVAISHDFLEKSVTGLKYNTKADEIAEICDTSLSGRLQDSKKIFEGLRTRQRTLLKEHNFISSFSECNNIMYLGCKDGTICVCDQRSQATPMKTFVPHNGKDVLNLATAEDFLVTLSVGSELSVWDTKHFMDSDKFEPEQIAVIDKVSSFELRTVNQKVTLYFCKESAIYSSPIQVGQPIDQTNQSTRELDRLDHALYTYHARDGRILFADKNENVYLLIGDEAKLMLEKNAGSQVKFLYCKDDIVTIVLSDSQAKETILTTINLTRFAEDEEQKRKEDEEFKKKEEEEETKKATMGDQEFRQWKMQQHQMEQSETEALIKKKQTGAIVEEIKEETVIANVLSIGECGGASLSGSQEELLISGTGSFLIFKGNRWEDQRFDVKNDTSAFKTVFASNGICLYIMGNDSVLKIMEWKNPAIQYPTYINEKEVQEAVGTKDGKYFATLSRNQSRIVIYSYLDCSIIRQFDHMEYTYLMNFSADSSSLVCVQGTDEPHIFNIVLIKVEAKPEESIIVVQCKIAEDYPIFIDASLTKQEIYMISKSESSSNLHIYGFDRKIKKTIRDATSLSVSTDEKILAYANTSQQVHMIFIKQKQPDIPLGGSPKKSPKKVSQSSTKRGSFSPSKTSSLMITPENAVDEKVINTIELSDNALTVQFYGNNIKIAIQTSQAIMGYDIYTHEVLFKIQDAASKLLFKRIQVQFDDFINFSDAGSSLCIYDINYYLEKEYISLYSKPLKKFTLNINKIHSTNHVVWAVVGNHLLMQQQDKLWFQANPFLHHQLENEIVHSGPFDGMEGYFVPTLLGGPKLGTGSFAQIYKQAVVKGKEDVTAMMTPIYPYKVNALHYFAMTSNVEGAQTCFANKVKFTLDQFGKSPLDYAIATKDKLIIETILGGLDLMENEEKIKILRTLPLNVLIEHPAPVLANILLSSGASIPLDTKFGKGATKPSLFPIKRIGFGESGLPYYSIEVASQLHPPKLVKPKSKNRPVSTFVLNNPVPRNFTDDSLSLLASIVDCSNDEIVRSKPITLYLNRKWDSYGYAFYFTQFMMFVTLLMALTALDSNKNFYVVLFSGIISVSINTYFFIFEILQMAILHFEYFMSPNNLLDLGRLAAIYIYLFSVVDDKFELPFYVLPTTFLLMWFKILSYLQVFKPTRYLIKMIFEIIGDITTFLVILFTALFAYAQITYIMTDNTDKELTTDLKNSYVLGLGELGEFGDFGYLQFFIFIMFSFLVPLVLMNMLIALMADSYTRVQSNAVAADARALADMLMEMEEVMQFVFSMVRPSMIKNEFYYCFTTKVNDEEEEEDWEGTVGQLKRTIEEATALLENNLINAVEEMSKKSTEKIIDNMLRANKQELDVIDTIQTVLEKETKEIRVAFEQQLLDESQKVKDQFNHTLKKLDEDAKKIENEFKKTHEKMTSEYEEVKNEFLKTHEKMDQESKQVKEEFSRTHTQINEQGIEVKADLEKAHKDIENSSQAMQNEIKKAQEKVDNSSKMMNEELKKAHEMITDVNSQVVSTSSSIVQNVQNSTAKTQESLLQKIESQSSQDTKKVESQVEKQTIHHNEMVTFAVDTQQKVTDLLSQTSEQQSKLLILVDELKAMQNKGLVGIQAAEDELMKKKEFEQSQNEAADQIKKLLGDLKEIESENSNKKAEELKAQEKKEEELKEQLKTIQTEFIAMNPKFEKFINRVQEELAKMHKDEEERIIKQKAEMHVQEEISNITKSLIELSKKYDEKVDMLKQNYEEKIEELGSKQDEQIEKLGKNLTKQLDALKK